MGVGAVSQSARTASEVFIDFHGTHDGLEDVRFIALECLREQTGAHPCDRRRDISEQTVNFPHVDFSFIQSNIDPLYSIYGTEREPSEDVMKRVEEFWRFISLRKEKNIAVVTHSAFLNHFSWPAGENGHFKNCEMRSYSFQFPLPPEI